MSSLPLEPSAAFLELGAIRFDNTNLDGILLRVAELAKLTVAGTADVSVTRVQGERAFTAAFTGDDALLESRVVIEQAKGIVMALRGCNAQKAFEVLTTHSQQANRKLRDLATDIVATAARGDTTDLTAW